MAESNGKILEICRMIRQDIENLEKKFNKLPCNDNIIKINMVEQYVEKKLKEEEIVKHTFLKEIIKYSVPAIIFAVIIVIANMGGMI